jgi:hypothetical protein
MSGLATSGRLFRQLRLVENGYARMWDEEDRREIIIGKLGPQASGSCLFCRSAPRIRYD